MADDRETTPQDQDDHFGYGQQPLRRTDETTGDEGLAPPTGEGPEEATIGRSNIPPDMDDDAAQGERSQSRGDAEEERVP